MRGTRRFSQAISEGDGISVVADVADDAAARDAEAGGAEAIVVRGASVAGVRAATELPILWCAAGEADEAVAAGADALMLPLHRSDTDDVVRRHDEAQERGIDCVVSVRNEDELRAALEELDPEILLLAPESPDALEGVLALLPDVPAGKLAVADLDPVTPEQVAELERAGVDAVIVRTPNVAALVGHAPPF